MVTSRFVRTVLLGSAIVFLLSWWQRDALPPPSRLDEAVFSEPVQKPTGVEPFRTNVGGIEYTVRPLYHYDLSGLVVSKHNADTWWDRIHEASNDKLNVTDLCVIWGNNVRNARYGELDYSSGQFVCYVQTSSSDVWATFDMYSLSNNHMLADDPRIAKVLRAVRVGDQIRFQGYLAEYSHNHQFAFHRGTSITRTDTGNGACETVFATDARIIRHANRGWRFAFWASAVAFLAGVVAWFRLPFRVDD
ncbi:MAG TPA: hypothetical protein PLW68_00745 [Casimicrobiaceae bacterium]|nr:hypothetical protein [Casimicrobiaceae bacterium]